MNILLSHLESRLSDLGNSAMKATANCGREWGGLPFPIAAVYPEEFEALEADGMGVAAPRMTSAAMLPTASTRRELPILFCQ
jgi:hypothetical protein